MYIFIFFFCIYFLNFVKNFVKNVKNLFILKINNPPAWDQGYHLSNVFKMYNILESKAIIEENNKDITDSIQYAKKIQDAILPSIPKFNKAFKDSFIFYKPRDIKEKVQK